MVIEIISWSISTKVWDQAWIELANPGSAVRHVSAAWHITDCTTQFIGNWPFLEFYKGIIRKLSCSFSYNFFVKLSLYNIIHSKHCPFLWPKHSVIMGLHCIILYMLNRHCFCLWWSLTAQSTIFRHVVQSTREMKGEYKVGTNYTM